MPGVFKTISNQDKNITDFKVYKSWNFTSTSSLSTSDLVRTVAIKPDNRVFSGNKVTLDSFQLNRDTGSYLFNSSSQQPASMLWYNLNHLYYKRSKQPYEHFGTNNVDRKLYDEASVIFIPQQVYGESIKPGTVVLNLSYDIATVADNIPETVTWNLQDDGKGNLIDTSLSSSITNELLHIGFDTLTYSPMYLFSSIGVSGSITNRNVIDRFDIDTIIPDLDIEGKNVLVTPNYNVPVYPQNAKSGNSAYFNSSSYIRISNHDTLNFKQSNNYAISFWTNRTYSNTQNSYILSKRTTGSGKVLKNGLLEIKDVNYKCSQYPFDILYKDNSSTLTCRTSNGVIVTELTGSINVGETKHVLLQKTGSQFELYLDGALVDSHSMPIDGNIYNNADIFIGSLGVDANKDGISGMSGVIDDFFIFDRGLLQSEITQLSYKSTLNSMTINTNKVGSVFYEHGVIVISDPRPKYNYPNYKPFGDVLYDYRSDVFLPPTISSFNLSFNSTKTIYEHEYICKINEDEFNFTGNPTIRKDNDMNSEIAKDFIYNTEFSPYITTVGLYDDKGQLLATGKLGSAIKKRDNVDLNIIVRFDI